MTATPDSASRAQLAMEQGLGNAALMTAALALYENRLETAEPLLRAHLKSDPFDVVAMRMLAEVAARIGRYKDAETLLERALALAPEFGAARANLATVLHKQNRPQAALAQLEHLIDVEPDNINHNNLKAAALSRIGGFDEAIGLYEAVLKQAPNQPKVWMSYAHMQKTVGRTDEAIKAYRRALEIAPHLGEVWWSLANLKTVRFSPEDIEAMLSALHAPNLGDEDRFHLDFALGKAYEDTKTYDVSFAHYQSANDLRRQSLAYDAAETSGFVERACALFTHAFFAAREGQGCAAPDPIFIIGMPRSGSTLIEQILASHSQIEGTSELPDIPALARRFVDYPRKLCDLSPEKLSALGEDYLARTRIQRKSGKPYFIDKLPNNWAHVGFIHLILPKAKIIDARRHPLDCCFSNFKQHFARGQAFSYGLSDMGHYYADYVRLMQHMDAVLPKLVHRVIYEQMVEETQATVQALLAALGLTFEAGCLRFYDNDRAVRTASSEQVRKPINKDGVEAYRGFEPWLDPLKAALGPVLESYPQVPSFGPPPRA
jgi:tetratricopeptide (TPR) repeat protein